MNFLKRLEQLKDKAYSLTDALDRITSNTPAQHSTNMVTQVRPGLCHMPFPDLPLIEPLAEFVTSKFGVSFFIWNLGEEIYDSEPFLNQVSHTSVLNYPVLPLANLLLVAVNIKQWLKQEGNVALVHCGKNKARSALLLAVYLYLDGWHEYLEDAIVEVNKLLSLNKNQSIFPSQHGYIRNCTNLFHGLDINAQPLRLRRVMLNKIPELINARSQEDRFKPSVAIYQLNTCLAVVEQSHFSGDSVSINLDVEVMDDILIWIKHKEGDELYSCFRVILNTNFVTDNILRIGQNELDLTKNVKSSKGFFIDFMFETGSSGSKSRLSEVWKEVQKSFKLQQQKKHIRKVQQEVVQQSLKEVSVSTAKEPHETSFTIDDVPPSPSVSPKEVPKIVQQLVMQQLKSEEEAEDIDDYIKELEQSIDMS